MTYLSWDEDARPSGLGGARPKAREGTGAGAVYYKLPHKGSPEEQLHEVLAELMSSRLMDALGVDHAPVHVVRGFLEGFRRPVWVVRSKTYRGVGQRAMPLSRFWELRCLPGETSLDLCLRMGWSKQIGGMALADYLSATRNRDASCFEVLCDAGGAYHLAPLLPRSFSFLNAFPGNTWRLFATADVNSSNYLGSSSLEENLSLVPASMVLPPLTNEVKEKITGGLYGLGADDFVDASWGVLKQRWRHCESLRHL